MIVEMILGFAIFSHQIIPYETNLAIENEYMSKTVNEYAVHMRANEPNLTFQGRVINHRSVSNFLEDYRDTTQVYHDSMSLKVFSSFSMSESINRVILLEAYDCGGCISDFPYVIDHNHLTDTVTVSPLQGNQLTAPGILKKIPTAWSILSPDNTKVTYLNTQNNVLELWVFDYKYLKSSLITNIDIAPFELISYYDPTPQSHPWLFYHWIDGSLLYINPSIIITPKSTD